MKRLFYTLIWLGFYSSVCLADNKLLIAHVSYNPIPGDVSGNLERLNQIFSSIDGPVDIITTPELSLTGMLFDGKKILGSLISNPEKELSSVMLLAKLKEVDIILGGLMIKNGKIFNSLFYIDHVHGQYRIVHKYCILNPQFSAPDEMVANIVTVNDIDIGLMICCDINRPNLLSLYGEVEVLLVPSNWCCLENDDYWENASGELINVRIIKLNRSGYTISRRVYLDWNSNYSAQYINGRKISTYDNAENKLIFMEITF